MASLENQIQDSKFSCGQGEGVSGLNIQWRLRAGNMSMAPYRLPINFDMPTKDQKSMFFLLTNQNTKSELFCGAAAPPPPPLHGEGGGRGVNTAGIMSVPFLLDIKIQKCI